MLPSKHRNCFIIKFLKIQVKFILMMQAPADLADLGFVGRLNKPRSSRTEPNLIHCWNLFEARLLLSNKLAISGRTLPASQAADPNRESQ